MTTNYEKIKAMSIDEMAEFITCDDCFYCNATRVCKVWQEVEKWTPKACNKYAKQWLESEEE